MVGRGRKAIGEPITVRLDDKLLSRVVSFSKEQAVGRPEAIRQLISKGLDPVSKFSGVSVNDWLTNVLSTSFSSGSTNVIFSLTGQLLEVSVRGFLAGDRRVVDCVSGYAFDSLVSYVADKIKVELADDCDTFSGSFTMNLDHGDVPVNVFMQVAGGSRFIVFRCLNPVFNLSVNDLGFSSEVVDEVLSLLPTEGALLVAGAAGSGKTLFMSALTNSVSGVTAVVNSHSFLSGFPGCVYFDADRSLPGVVDAVSALAPDQVFCDVFYGRENIDIVFKEFAANFSTIVQFDGSSVVNVFCRLLESAGNDFDVFEHLKGIVFCSRTAVEGGVSYSLEVFSMDASFVKALTAVGVDGFYDGSLEKLIYSK